MLLIEPREQLLGLERHAVHHQPAAGLQRRQAGFDHTGAGGAAADEDRVRRLQAGERIGRALVTANGAIFERTLSEPDKRGMGTTVTTLVLMPGRYLIGQVGDSRAYLLRDGQLLQITRDHSYVQEQVDAGLLTPEQARTGGLRAADSPSARGRRED